jgi:hypothetical protein
LWTPPFETIKESDQSIAALLVGRTAGVIRRAAVLTTELERFEAQFALAEQNGEPTSIDIVEAYARITANLRRLLESIGLQRRPKNVTPTVNEYLTQRQNIDAEVIDADG